VSRSNKLVCIKPICFLRLIIEFILELGDGHYWVNNNLELHHPIRLIGDEHNPANVTIEMGGTLVWKAKGGFCEGITFRRPKLGTSNSTKKTLLRLETGSRLDVLECVLDNDGGNDHLVVASNCKGVWNNALLRNGDVGVVLANAGALHLEGVSVMIVYALPYLRFYGTITDPRVSSCIYTVLHSEL
jgi:hypothetical protein